MSRVSRLRMDWFELSWQARRLGNLQLSGMWPWGDQDRRILVQSVTAQ